MSQVFLNILNMSISASYVVLAVLLLRILFKRAPRWIAVVLWGIVALRLVSPFSIESVLSLIPSAETVSPGIMMDTVPSIDTGIPVIDNSINPIINQSFAPVSGDNTNPLQVIVPILATVWVAGMVALLIYMVVSYVRVRRKIGTAVLYKDNIYQSENVGFPFVLGIFSPKVYLPFDMDERDIPHVVAHEQAHILRMDYLWKPLGFLLLAVHWFNPLMWLSYILLCRDIEIACDEKVVKKLDRQERADYSQALLTCSVKRITIAACPLAFGEVGVKNRVRSVLSYRKPAFWIVVVALTACVVVAVCFLTDPVKDSTDQTGDVSTPTPTPILLNDEYKWLLEYCPEYFGIDASDGLDVYVWQMAANSYSFGVLPHKDAQRHGMGSELMGLKATSADQMLVILSTYDLEEDNIHIVPWRNPFSSYIPDWSAFEEGEGPEDADDKKAEYIESVRNMLFGEKNATISVVNQFAPIGFKGDISSLPKTITVVPSDSKFKGITAGETACTDVSLPDYSDMVEKYLATDYGIDSVADMFPMESGVVCEIVDPDFGVVEDSRVVVERIYTYYDTFSGVMVADSFIRVSVDAEGINGVEYNRLTIPADADFMDPENLVGEEYCSPWEAQAAVMVRYPTASIDKISIAYVPVEGDVHVLCYEFIIKGAGPYYVEVSTGKVIER